MQLLQKILDGIASVLPFLQREDESGSLGKTSGFLAITAWLSGVVASWTGGLSPELAAAVQNFTNATFEPLLILLGVGIRNAIKR